MCSGHVDEYVLSLRSDFRQRSVYYWREGKNVVLRIKNKRIFRMPLYYVTILNTLGMLLQNLFQCHLLFEAQRHKRGCLLGCNIPEGRFNPVKIMQSYGNLLSVSAHRRMQLFLIVHHTPYHNFIHIHTLNHRTHYVRPDFLKFRINGYFHITFFSRISVDFLFVPQK